MKNPKSDIRQIRQGDVFLLRIDPVDGAELATGPDFLPLVGLRVEGERTGHSHELPGLVYDLPDGRRAIRLEEPTILTHQEHEHIRVPEGWWEIRIQREWIPREGWRRPFFPGSGPQRGRWGGRFD